MKNITRIAVFLFIALFLAGCSQPVETVTKTVIQPVDYSTDARLEMMGAEDAYWMRYPSSARFVAGGPAENDPITALCTEYGYAYMFYDDGAVIGYAPFPDRVTIMHQAVSLTVENHNRDNPDALWDFINVAPYTEPVVTSNDPVMGEWQVCLCLDTGEIVAGPYTAEFLFNWTAFRQSVAGELDSYNRDHALKAHAVWGPDKPATEPEPAL